MQYGRWKHRSHWFISNATIILNCTVLFQDFTLYEVEFKIKMLYSNKWSEKFHLLLATLRNSVHYIKVITFLSALINVFAKLEYLLQKFVELISHYRGRSENMPRSLWHAILQTPQGISFIHNILNI